MPYQFDPMSAVTGVQPAQHFDFGAGFRALADQAMAKQRMAEQQRQFDVENQRLGRQENDTNARFALEQEERGREKDYALNQARYQKRLDMATKARELVAAGKWNDVEAMLGSMKDEGIDVQRTFDANGMPNYRFQVQPWNEHAGRSYEDIVGKVNANRQQSNLGATPLPSQQRDNSEAARNPFDTSIGTARAAATVPGQAPVAQPSAIPQQQAVGDQQDELSKAGIGYNQATAGESPSERDVSNQPTTTSSQLLNQAQQGDVNMMSTARLAQMTAMRLDPTLQGLRQAFPSQFQGLVGNYLDSLKSLHQSPEATLETMQKPLDTLSKLYGAQLNAEAANARLAQTQAGQASSEARQRENEAFNRSDKLAKETGVAEAVNAAQKLPQLLEDIKSNNPTAQANAVKQIIALTEGHHISDQDFKVGFQGMPSVLDQAQQALQHIYQGGLTGEAKYNAINGVQKMIEHSRQRVKQAFSDAKSYADSFRYEPERLGVYNHIRGLIPEQFWDAEMRAWDPTQNQGGMPVGTGGQPRTSKSVSVKAGNATEAAAKAKDLSEFLDEEQP